MSTITLSCLVVGKNPYDNSFLVDIDTNKVKTVGHLKKAIKEEQPQIFTNVDAKDINEKLPPIQRLANTLPSQPADEHIHIIVQRPVETKEIHCTATYGRKKEACEYFMFPDETENGHIVIGRIVGGAGLKRKISTSKMHKKLDQTSSSSQSASDTVEIATECKVIQFSADEDLLSIIWTANSKADSYDHLSCIEIGSSATPEEIRNSVIENFLRMHKASPPITSANEATRCEFISAIIYVYPQYEVSPLSQEETENQSEMQEFQLFP
ncbi:14521_t:CDS:2, partial [Racocetra fulgida]